MSEEWKPGTRVEMLPGLTAERYGWIALGCVAGLIVSAAVLVVGMLITDKGYLDHPVTLTAMVVMDLSVVTTLTSWALTSRKRRAEFRAGYTTAVTEEYAEVDPKSSQVIRLAGEELLTSAEYRRRIRLVRGDGISPEIANGPRHDS